MNDNQKDCLIWHYVVDQNGRGVEQEPTVESEVDVAKRYAWYHFRSDMPDSAEQMKNLGLDPVAVETMTAIETRPRTLSVGGGLLVVLRAVNMNPGSDPEDMISVRVWLGADLVVTARKNTRRVMSILDIRNQLSAGSGPPTPTAFLICLLEGIANRVNQVVDSVDEGLSTLESNGGGHDHAKLRRAISGFRRECAALRRYLAPQREALEVMFRQRRLFSETEVYELQQLTDRMIRYVEELDLARERALLMQEELQNRIAEQQNQRMYLLSLVTAIFLPLSFLTGVFGMNVAGLPGTETPEAFFYLSVGMLSVGAIVLALMYWKKWL